MTTLFDATRTRKSNRRFGVGILPSTPHFRLNHTAADEAWWAAESNRPTTAYDLAMDHQAAESLATDRLERGLCC
jgi:hypothetical protein